MLKKIKKYKITIRPSFALKHLKRKLELETMPDSLEKSVQEKIVQAQNLIIPSSIYNTYSKSETPDSLKSLWGYSPTGALSLSLILTTVGNLIEKEIEKCNGNSEEHQAAILDSIARESLEQSLHFTTKLLNEEAKLEACELTPLIPIEKSILGNALTLLESHKAEISLDANVHLRPIFSSLSFCFWTPTTKNRNAKSR